MNGQEMMLPMAVGIVEGKATLAFPGGFSARFESNESGDVDLYAGKTLAGTVRLEGDAPEEGEESTQHFVMGHGSVRANATFEPEDAKGVEWEHHPIPAQSPFTAAVVGVNHLAMVRDKLMADRAPFN